MSTASLSPLTTLSTPAGSPASISSSASRIGTDGSRSDGLRMKALPQASAGANFHIGIMAGKLNGVMPATTPSGWRMRIEVDAGAGALGVLALEQMRDAAGELDHFEPALDVALGVGEGLAVLGGEQPREVVEFPLQQLEELEHHARAPLRIGRGPGRLRRLGVGDRVLDLGLLGEGDLGLHLAGIGIEHVAGAAGRALHLLAADEVADLAHA